MKEKTRVFINLPYIIATHGEREITTTTRLGLLKNNDELCQRIEAILDNLDGLTFFDAENVLRETQRIIKKFKQSAKLF